MSLFSSLSSAANALSAFQSALTTTQNNVTNASTPGYAKQRATLEALPFQGGTGEVGGVTAGVAQSSRDEYAESNVQNATSQLGAFEQQVETLTSLQGQFDISGKSGVPAALTTLYSAFSNWSTSPNDSTARQNVMTAAQTVAGAFQSTASNISQLASATDTQTSSLVDQVNTLTAKLSGYNAQIEGGRQNDPSIDASIHTTLESLSELVNVTTIKQSNGTLTVVLGNSVPLVTGATQNKLTAHLSVPATPPPTNTSLLPTASLVDSRGTDVTANVTSGKLAGVLNVRNQVIPSIQGNSSQTGSLNQLTQAFADRVNTLVGFPLFSYDTTNVTNMAKSLQVSSTATAQQLPSPQVVSLTGSPVTASFTITTGSNDSLNLKIDGTSLSTITLNPADKTLADVAADLTAKFNAIPIGATASVNASGSLILATTNTGTSGSIQIMAGNSNATLGLTTPTPTYRSGAGAAALSLANLSNPQNSADEINGQSYTAFFGSIAASVGLSLSTAQSGQSGQQDVVTQAQSLRTQLSGVDLNAEAAQVLQLQTSYQAASKMVSVIDSMTQAVLALIQPS